MEQWEKLCDGIWCKRGDGAWKIRHEFGDGAVSEFEVGDGDFTFYEQLTKTEKSNDKRETRRHISLNYLNDSGIDFEDKPLEDNLFAGGGGEPLGALIKQEDETEFEAWLSSILRPRQIELLKMIWGGMTVTEIARREGVLHNAISNRLKRISDRIKNISENRDNLPFLVGIGGGTQSAYYQLRGIRK